MMVPTGLDNIKITFVTYFAINLLMTTGNELILRPIYGDFSLKKISMLIKNFHRYGGICDPTLGYSGRTSIKRKRLRISKWT